MSDIDKTAVIGVLGGEDKVAALQNIILEQANSQKSALAEEARMQSEQWLTNEMAHLEKEAEAVLADARARADDIHRRQLLAAERERSTELLRLQNRLMQDAMKKLTDGLVKLRERSDHADILAALAISAARELSGSAPLKLRLSSLDAALGDEIASRANKKVPDAQMTFVREPASIIGGCVVESGDGRRQMDLDWQTMAQDMSSVLAERLLETL